jgi:hypothetical protein
VGYLKGKILLASMVIALAILVSSPAANAIASVSVYGYTDKTNYMPGDSVTVTFYVYNYGPDQIVLANVTVIYPWYNILWGGNQTINANSFVIAKGKSYNNTATFTIPTDSRASSGDMIDFSFVYMIGSTTYTGSGSINFPLTSGATALSLRDMDTLATMLTVETILLIIGALIIAAAILLIKRGPKAEWKAEPKE